MGVLQGRTEFGPRALGNRSILADARSVKMQSHINLATKFREGFRPFAPIVLAEDAPEYFEVVKSSPYMLLVDRVRPERWIHDSQGRRDIVSWVNTPRSDIPAVTHVDYSARIQTVDPARHPDVHGILTEFKKLTGYGILVNTSFNVRSEPIVCTPEDAYRCFMRTGIDLLVLDDFVLEKAEQPPCIDTKDWRMEFGLIDYETAAVLYWSTRLLRDIVWMGIANRSIGLSLAILFLLVVGFAAIGAEACGAVHIHAVLGRNSALAPAVPDLVRAQHTVRFLRRVHACPPEPRNARQPPSLIRGNLFGRNEIPHVLEFRASRLRSVVGRLEQGRVVSLGLRTFAQRFRGHPGVVQAVEAVRAQRERLGYTRRALDPDDAIRAACRRAFRAPECRLRPAPPCPASPRLRASIAARPIPGPRRTPPSRSSRCAESSCRRLPLCRHVCPASPGPEATRRQRARPEPAPPHADALRHGPGPVSHDLGLRLLSVGGARGSRPISNRGSPNRRPETCCGSTGKCDA